jgi:hypothetical protein
VSDDKDAKPKKKKNGVAAALKQSVDIIAPVIDEGTVLRISVVVKDNDYSPPQEKTYTYAAVFVNNRWYLTGYTRLLNAEYATTIDLISACAKYPGTTIDLATEFESIR